MIFSTVLPKAATMPMARTNSGKAIMVSEKRPMMRSHQPPQKPATLPRALPITKDKATAERAILRSSRVATITRLNTSRPRLSVPKGWAQLGGLRVFEAAVAKGSYGARNSPNRPKKIMNRKSEKETTVTRFSLIIYLKCPRN